MAPPIPTKMVCSALARVWGASMYVKAEFSPIAESSRIVRSWNGTALNLSRPDFRLYRVVLSSDGDLIPPTIANLWPGDRFTLQPFADFATGPLDLVVTEPWRVTLDENAKSVGWTLVGEEYAPS